MDDPTKILPLPDPVSAPFWEGCRHHELLIQHCLNCRAFRFPPATLCPFCWSTQNEWVRSSGKGKVYSWIVVVHPVPKEIYAQRVPYVVALVELKEGVRISTNIVGCDPHSIKADMPVEVIFDDVSPEITLPKFRPI